MLFNSSPVVDGMVISILLLAGFVLSFVCFNTGKYTLALLVLVASGLLLKMYCASDDFLHNFDERYHALVAKNLAQHMCVPTLYDRTVLPLDFRNWTYTHIWLHKQPMALWLIATCIKLFGCHAWVVRAPSVVLSALGIKLMYDVGRLLYTRQAGFLAAFLFSIHGLIIELSAGRTDTDHIDVVFLFFVLLGVWAATKYAQHSHRWMYALLTGAAIGLAILTKWLPGGVVLAFWAVLTFKQVPVARWCAHGVVIMVTAAAIAVPWQVYTHAAFPAEAQWEYSYNVRHFYEAIEGHSGGYLYHFNNLRIMYGELVYIAVGWFAYITIKGRTRADVAMLVLFVLPFMFYSVAATKMPVYTIIAAPAIFMMTAQAAIAFWQQKQQARVMKVVAALLLLLPVRYSFERAKLFEPHDTPDWQAQMNQIQHSKWNSSRTVVFNYPHYVELMFATSCLAYEQKPDDALQAQLKARNYQVLVPP